MAQHLSFRNSKIIYYGPHPCDNCGVTVAKMGHDWGGTSFTYPEGPIYPNTEWHPHVCDQQVRWAYQVSLQRKWLKERIGSETRATNIGKPGSPRWVIVDPSGAVMFPHESVYCLTENDAWNRVHREMTEPQESVLPAA